MGRAQTNSAAYAMCHGNYGWTVVFTTCRLSSFKVRAQIGVARTLIFTHEICAIHLQASTSERLSILGLDQQTDAKVSSVANIILHSNDRAA